MPTEASATGSAGAPERSQEEPPSSVAHLLLHGPSESLAVAGPDWVSLEAAHRAIDHLVDQHRQAAEAANRARQRLEDWQCQLTVQQAELDTQHAAFDAAGGEAGFLLAGGGEDPSIIADLTRHLAAQRSQHDEDIRLLDMSHAGIVTSLTESSQRAEECARDQEELVATHLGTITQLCGALVEKQQELERSARSVERSRESAAQRLHEFPTR